MFCSISGYYISVCQLCVMVSVCFQPPASEGVSVVYHGVCMLSATSQWRGVSCVSWCVSVCFQPPASEGVSVVYHGVCLYGFSHHPVKGVSVWCQGCCHGGHIAHIQEWLASNIFCPTGCGHICEYTWVHLLWPDNLSLLLWAVICPQSRNRIIFMEVCIL